MKQIKRVSDLKYKSGGGQYACPKCGDSNCAVLDSRPLDNNSMIRRRRGCYSCDHRWSTWETNRQPVHILTPEEISLEGLTAGEKEMIRYLVRKLRLR